MLRTVYCAMYKQYRRSKVRSFVFIVMANGESLSLGTRPRPPSLSRETSFPAFSSPPHSLLPCELPLCPCEFRRTFSFRVKNRKTVRRRQKKLERARSLFNGPGGFSFCRMSNLVWGSSPFFGGRERKMLGSGCGRQAAGNKFTVRIGLEAEARTIRKSRLSCICVGRQRTREGVKEDELEWRKRGEGLPPDIPWWTFCEKKRKGRVSERRRRQNLLLEEKWTVKWASKPTMSERKN